MQLHPVSLSPPSTQNATQYNHPIFKSKIQLVNISKRLIVIDEYHADRDLLRLLDWHRRRMLSYHLTFNVSCRQRFAPERVLYDPAAILNEDMHVLERT